MRRLALLLLPLLLAFTGSALAAKNPAQTHLEATLKADMVKTFKQKAPKLTLTRVTCVLPKSGTTSRCKGYFTFGSTKGYYPVVATLHDLGGKLTWTARSPQCWNAAKKQYLACN